VYFLLTVKTKTRSGECYTCFGYVTKAGVVRILVIFDIDVCSATSFESFRRDLLNDMAERRPISKNNRNTYHPRFGFTPKTGKAFLITGFCFYCACFSVV